LGRVLKPAVRSPLTSLWPQLGQMKNGILDRLQVRAS
jgi:hypothetical protein